ncbi:MAG: nucleoside monophosphate kinase [Candidatus Fermentibacter sp.]|nr:nucleoside monophosphate kinase [Candidatus Fermentibacter sp.]
MRISLLGPPGAGKGTQAARAAARFGLAHLSTGAIFREEIGRGTPLGREIEGIVKAGLLVADETVDRVVFSRIDGPGGFVLDGYPRNIAQARSLDAFLADSVPIDGAVFLDVSEGEVLRRLGDRYTCPSCGPVRAPGGACPSCGRTLERRADDEPEVIRRRFQEYHRVTGPLLSYYGPRLARIDGDAGVEEVWSRLEQAVMPWA